MPEYLYQCEDKHQVMVVHGMMEMPRIFCHECGKTMRKRPMVSNVLWSRFIEPSPAVKNHLKNVERKREENFLKYGS